MGEGLHQAHRLEWRWTEGRGWATNRRFIAGRACSARPVSSGWQPRHLQMRHPPSGMGLRRTLAGTWHTHDCITNRQATWPTYKLDECLDTIVARSKWTPNTTTNPIVRRKRPHTVLATPILEVVVIFWSSTAPDTRVNLEFEWNKLALTPFRPKPSCDCSNRHHRHLDDNRDSHTWCS